MGGREGRSESLLLFFVFSLCFQHVMKEYYLTRKGICIEIVLLL